MLKLESPDRVEHTFAFLSQVCIGAAKEHG
jgi:hypothetical protein